MQIGDGKKKKEKIHEARVSLVAIDKSYIESRCVLLVIDFQDGLSSLERVVVVIERKKERKKREGISRSSSLTSLTSESLTLVQR